MVYRKWWQIWRATNPNPRLRTSAEIKAWGEDMKRRRMAAREAREEALAEAQRQRDEIAELKHRALIARYKRIAAEEESRIDEYEEEEEDDDSNDEASPVNGFVKMLSTALMSGKVKDESSAIGNGSEGQVEQYRGASGQDRAVVAADVEAEITRRKKK